MTDLVTITDQKAITTSLTIAEVFGKSHYHVLRDIENLECSEMFRELNFEPSSYLTSQGKALPMFQITRDGFVFLAMGFTGKKAAEFKEKFIAAFNAMEQALIEQRFGTRKTVDVNHTHNRSTLSPHGLDIRYTLDLTKIITNPTGSGLALLGELTGCDLEHIMDMVEYERGAAVDDLPCVPRFVEECCILAPAAKISKDDLYNHYMHYARRAGEVLLPKSTFARQLLAQCPDVTSARPRTLDPETGLRPRVWHYAGIGLKARNGQEVAR